MTLVAPTLQAFFTDRLTQQRQASPRTIAVGPGSRRPQARDAAMAAQTAWVATGGGRRNAAQRLSRRP